MDAGLRRRRAWSQIAAKTLSGNSLRQTVHTHSASVHTHTHTHTRTRPFNGPFSGTTQVSRYQKGKTNLDFTEARDGEWKWHQLGHMQVCILLQTDNHTSTPPLSFLQAGCPSCRPTNSVKALKQEAKLVAALLRVAGVTAGLTESNGSLPLGL